MSSSITMLMCHSFFQDYHLSRFLLGHYTIALTRADIAAKAAVSLLRPSPLAPKSSGRNVALV